MEEIKNQLIQTGFNLDRLHDDEKIDDDAYTILKNRNNQALALCEVVRQSEQLPDDKLYKPCEGCTDACKNWEIFFCKIK